MYMPNMCCEVEPERSDSLSTWTDTMIDAKIDQLMNEAARVIEAWDKKIQEINARIAELQNEKLRRLENESK